MYSAARRKVSMVAMNVMSWKTAQKVFMGQTTMMLLPARRRACLLKSTEKKNLKVSTTNYANNMKIQKQCRMHLAKV